MAWSFICYHMSLVLRKPVLIIIIIIIIIISIFKEDNVCSMIASLPYGPPVNTDIDYYRTFFGLFCECCNVSCATFVRRFRPGPTQTGLCNQGRWLEAGNFGFRK